MGAPIIWFGTAAKLLKSALKIPGSTSGTLTIQSAAATTDHTLTYPAAQGAASTALTNDGSGGLTWTVPPGAWTMLSKSGGYTAVAGDYIACDTTSASFTITLPTAASITGQRIYIKKTASDANTVTINTTSAQTIEARASGEILLRRSGDFIEVISDGSNWGIVSKLQHETVLASTSYAFSSAGADGNYGTAACSVALVRGRWRIKHTYMVNTGSAGTGIFLYSGTGLYAADGANSASVPTALSGSSSMETKIGSVNSGFGMPNSSVANLRPFAISLVAEVQLTAASTTVYAVPQLGYTTASTASVIQAISAERIW